MVRPSPFEFSSYKDFLKGYIEANPRKGIVTELARGAGCDRTYLSQALGSKVNLTPDHGLGIAEHLRMSEVEADYFLLLILHGRAAQKKARKLLEAKLAQRAREHLAVTEKIRSRETPSEASPEQRDFYYSSWKPAAAHLLTSLPETRTIHAVASRLNLPEAEAAKILQELARMGLVEPAGGAGYKHSGRDVHLSKGGPHIYLKHLHWRMKALESVNSQDSLHYTSVFTISRSDWPSLKHALLQFIENQREAVHHSGSEELYSFCCDLFQV